MSQKTFGNALNEALSIAMDTDDSVFVAGEGVGISIHQDPNMPTHGLLEKFGRRRVKDTPVSEAAIAGLAVGASCMGLRPVVEIMFFPFLTLASDMLINHAGKLRYMSGGKKQLPFDRTDQGRRRLRGRQSALSQPGGVDSPQSGPENRLAGDRRGCQGTASQRHL